MHMCIETQEEVVVAEASTSMTVKQRNDTGSFLKTEMEITHHQRLQGKKKRGCLVSANM